MLKRTKRQLLIIFLVVSTLSGIHFIVNHANVNDIKNILYIDDAIDRYFGTKSRYPKRSEISGAKLNVDSKFQLRQVQLVCRHGTRYPTGTNNFNEKIEYMKEFLYSNSKLFPEKFEFLSFFENPYRENDYGLLDIQGVKDMQNLAKRAIHRYGNITNTIDDLSKIRIYSTNVSRVVDSAAAFISTIKIYLDEMNEGDDNENDNVRVDKETPIIEQDALEALSIDIRNFEYDDYKINALLESDINNYEDDFSYFKNDEILKYINIYEDRNKDIILSPHIACPLFSEEINSEDRDRTEINNNIKLLQKKYIHGVNSNLMKVLNLREEPDIGDSIMNMCIFEVALNNTRNQFCSLIDKPSFENFGFYEDYKNYHIKGYYNEVNQWLATPLFKEIVNDIDKEILQLKAPMKIRDTYNNNIVLRFAHAETIFPLITLLGLYKDKKHLSLKDSPPKSNYRFRTAEMAPFAANFWFELYEIETKYILGYKPEDDLIYTDNPFGNENVTNILKNLEESEKNQNKNTTFVLRILLNEKDISIPGCSPIEIVDINTREKTKYHNICLLSQFKHLYKSILNTTIDDYKKKCHIPN